MHCSWDRYEYMGETDTPSNRKIHVKIDQIFLHELFHVCAALYACDTYNVNVR